MSGNMDVVLVDRSTSFCQLVPDCLEKIDAVISDQAAELSKHGGSVRVLLIGNDAGGAVQESSNDKCTGLLRGAAACFPKPTRLDFLFGKSGTQKKSALRKIGSDISIGLRNSRVIYGTSIIDAVVAAQHYIDDRRLPYGNRRLIILSDMIEESHTDIPALTCANVGTPAQNRAVLDQLRDQDRVRDLNHVEIQVLGATSSNARNGSCRESFWRSYFDRAGADLVAYQSL